MEMTIMCKDDSPNGISNKKEYTVLETFNRKDGKFYGVIDDYGVYSEFSSSRFKPVLL